MNTRAHSHATTLALAALCFCANVTATTPEETDNPDLILTLSDSQTQWQDDNTGGVLKHENHPSSSLVSPRQPKRPAALNCGVDSNPLAEGNSLSGLLVGECNFNYKY
ncbi:MAG: hypothetical protein KGZ80_05685 [Methylomonas sp.]|nr:hypothetical protein [Methylomonas sp.]PPD20731.1 MAG: hypothetical protein CTY23_07905 [Methylomonas sp.]PPD26228.1 MAG: hypothetical protein CTY22_05920 [Methylomonas sp.]PPD37946.1 MAG: hypothetical protein CTY21_05915 [Methylomonas sp.]PPD54632.1 MAG: hypothetical protein CTY11_03285 [Methylomonas sp.]